MNLLHECYDLFFQLVFTESEASNLKDSQFTQFTSLSYMKILMILNVILQAQAQLFTIQSLCPNEAYQAKFFEVFEMSRWIADLQKSFQKTFSIEISEDLFACLYALFHEYTYVLQTHTQGFSIKKVDNLEDPVNLKLAQDRLRQAIKIVIQCHSMPVLFTQWQENPKVDYLSKCLELLQSTPSHVSVQSLLQIFQKCQVSDMKDHVENANEVFPQQITVQELLPWYLFQKKEAEKDDTKSLS